MWFRLTQANFTVNLGTLDQYTITTSGSGFSYSGPSYWDKTNTEAFSATITLLSGYTLNSISITMGGSTVSDAVTDNGDGTHTINIASVTGDIKITVDATGSSSGGSDTTTTYTFTINPTPSDATVTLTATGYEQEGNSITVASGTSVSWSVSADGYTTQSGTQTVTSTSTKNVTIYDSSWAALPTTKYALGVTSSGTGRVSSGNAKRFSTADDENENGILIPAGSTMHLSGLASGTYALRVDYLYCTDNALCPVAGSTTAIEGLVGTCSNYVSSNYFPLNKDGADTLDITNTYGADYYFWFGFAGPNLTEAINDEYDTYTLMYKID